MNLVFCLVSLLGAFLPFQVQPLISKFILPWFGGSPGVWTTCMLFFLVVLFGGYSTAHLLAKGRPRTQAWVHGSALLIAALLLPIVLDAALKPTGAEEPVLRILMLLAWTVGLPHPQTETHAIKPTYIRRVLWLLLAGFAELLLLSTTNHVCQDVAMIPFLWVAPLSLYLVSLIICFNHPRWYARSAWALPALALLFYGKAMYEFENWTPSFVAQLVVQLAAMFNVCMVCHGELARLKPDKKFLTEYYLLMSAGGALGGLIVSIMIPLLFDTYLEWSLALLAGFALVSWAAFAGLPAVLRSRPWQVAWGMLTLAGLIYIGRLEFTFDEEKELHRDFYGLLSVSECQDEDTGETLRSFINGNVKHGRQNITPTRRRDPLTHYSRPTGIGPALETLKNQPDARVGVIGMGAGTVACYAEKGQTYRFYEVNPNAERLALKWFTFITDMQTRGAVYEPVIGNTPLTLEHDKPQNFDVLLLDALSGGSVPVHLLTREAFELYLRHLKQDGIIVVHITNHSLNLAPVVAGVASEFGLHSSRLANDSDEDGCYPTDYMLLTRNAVFIQANPPIVPDYARAIDVPLWNDPPQSVSDSGQSLTV